MGTHGLVRLSNSAVLCYLTIAKYFISISISLDNMPIYFTFECNNTGCVGQFICPRLSSFLRFLFFVDTLSSNVFLKHQHLTVRVGIETKTKGLCMYCNTIPLTVIRVHKCSKSSIWLSHIASASASTRVPKLEYLALKRFSIYQMFIGPMGTTCVIVVAYMDTFDYELWKEVVFLACICNCMNVSM